MDILNPCRSRFWQYLLFAAVFPETAAFLTRNLPGCNLGKTSQLQRGGMGMVMTTPEPTTQSTSSDDIVPLKEKPSSLIRAEEWFAAAVQERRPFAATVLEPLAQSGMEVLQSIEKLPTRKDEPYRYADLESLYRTRYTAPAEQSSITAEDVQPYFMEETEGRRLVFVDGVMDQSLTDLSAVPSGVFIGSISQVEENKLTSVLEQLALVPELDADYRTTQGSTSFAALNLACLADAAVMIVPAGVVVEKSIQVVFISTSEADRPSLCNHRLLVIANEDSKLNFIQNNIGKGSSHFSNGLTRLIVHQNASVIHTYLQEQPEEVQGLETVLSEVAGAGNYNLTSITYGGDKTRLNIQIDLNGEEALGQIEGAVVSGGQQSIAHYTSIRHNAENTKSRQQQRNILGESSDIVFKGRIRVEQIAQETDSDQLCRSLMLSDKAAVTAMPSMEIIADQVKCTHGATITDMSEEDLFYFQSRGIDRQKARNMIVLGFAREICANVKCEKFGERIYAKVATIVPKEETRSLDDYEFQSI
mmetsp:Transcript_19130/g.24695  ORF Transcript_19130/g.24695 Transcript_19130/m.24695 type:complete len:531 (+) Transcript_19130:113-1705(+)